MRGTPNDFWGKLEKDDDGEVVAWHPLKHHCADVAACAEALLSRTMIGVRLARLGGLNRLTDPMIARLSVLAAMHDVGKFNFGFQNKATQTEPMAGHVREALALLASGGQDCGQALHTLRFDEWRDWAGEPADTLDLLGAAICHHGRPYPIHAQQHSPSLWRGQAYGRSPFSGFGELMLLAESWYPAAWEPSDPLPSHAPFQHAFAGLVMLADWIGSDRDIFTFSTGIHEERHAASRERAVAALKKIGVDAEAAQASFGAKPVGFSSISKYEPYDAQAKVCDLPIPEEASVAILESETGSGKTEAALVHFLRLLQAGCVDGLYFALPTRTAATQLHTRTVDAVRLAFPDERVRPPVILAVPGYLRVDDVAGRRLPGFDVLWNDRDEERWRFRGWAAEHPKRYLAGAITVGTIDQVLLSALQVGHAQMRATALLRQLLVVDEVHASDAYMTGLLTEVLSRHLAAGGHAFLMSATLGATARYPFQPGQVDTLPSPDVTKRDPYPLLSYSHGSTLTTYAIASPGNPKTVAVELAPLMHDAEAIGRRALECAREGARVLVLRNTVADCVATQHALEAAATSRGLTGLLFRCGGIAAPHHARFAGVDRTLLDEAIEREFGRQRPMGGCVAVATQTIQQSLDLDADRMFTDLCPMDVLLQRVGRLHRHKRSNRPLGFAAATVVVLTPPQRALTERIAGDGRPLIPPGGSSHGIGTVYEDLRVLERTWRLLEAQATFEVPTHNRALVEDTTHPVSLSALHDEHELWASHGMRVGGSDLAQKRLAQYAVFKWYVPPAHMEFQRDVGVETKTRLGEGDRLVELEESIESPFGERVRRLTIPAWLARGAETNDPRVLETAPLRLQLGSRRYVYDRLGLREDVGPHEATK